MLKGSKPPLPAPRQTALIEQPPPLPVRQRKEKLHSPCISNSKNDAQVTASSQIQALKDFAIRKNFTSAEFEKALDRTVSLDDTNGFLAQLIAVRADHGRQETQPENHKFSRYSASADRDKLRVIVIDGSNVAMNHGNGQVFSSRGIQIAVGWFQERGHKSVTVFVPSHRKEVNKGNRDVDILLSLEAEGNLKFTPSRDCPNGSRVTCYDDRFILKYASEEKAIVVSNDHFKDLASEDSGYRETIDQRLLGYIFINDRFMPAEDPMGRKGLTLDQFLRVNAVETRTGQCPYGRKCTYGNKCKYGHPERANSAIIGDFQPRKLQLRDGDAEAFMQRAQTDQNFGKPALHVLPRHRPKTLQPDPVIRDFEDPASLTSMPSLVSRCVSDAPEAQTIGNGVVRCTPTLSEPPGVRPIIHGAHNRHIQHSQVVYPKIQRRTVQSDQTRLSMNHIREATIGIVSPNLQPLETNASIDFTDPSHPSYSTFYHLQNLFPQEYVIAAMRQSPKEADSAVLCKAIMELM
ncbi:probable ribonuclease ZC3H12B [Watersipora subatra]|uniref:probable ribonuclease ZC3H12B n=1 Tax=Watersipora subatra TaxID=2589382 RepID=UPI00355BC8B2